MEANKITSEPLHGWRLNMNHSHVSLEWLLWKDSQLSAPRIQHARNTGEYRILNSSYTVDSCEEYTNTVPGTVVAAATLIAMKLTAA